LSPLSETVPPLAEGRWLWRRLFVFLTAAGLLRLLERVLDRMDAATAARAADGVLMLLGLTVVLYLVAPTAQQLIAFVAQLRRGMRA
jgi:multisubunit Na+/H+ antiporter MnhG subunit